MDRPQTSNQLNGKTVGKCFWAPFLHFYQPPTQDVHILKEINEECYVPLFSMFLDNPEFKCTFNINTVLLDLLADHGLTHTIDLLKKLVAKDQVEIVGSGKFHPILPLIPKQEVLHQIEMQEDDLKRTFPGWSKGGFYPPEMAISPGIASLVSQEGYKWVLSSGIACPSEWAFDKIYTNAEGHAHLFFRDDVISNEVSFKKISVEFFIEKLKVLYSTPHYIITAQDGETFGHHAKGYEKAFLEKAMRMAIEDDDIELVFISDLPAHFKAGGKVRPVASSWSTSQSDLDYNNPYPLWNHPDNPLHRIQFKFLKNIFELVYMLEGSGGDKPVQEATTARYFLDRGLHSCQFWWASARPMWSPNMVLKGAELLLRAAFNARIGIIDTFHQKGAIAESEENFDQVSQYYSLLLQEITKMEQLIAGKRAAQESLFESLFTSDKDATGGASKK
ncbi:MAG: hypothetical protein JW839_03715 [Candidatus Lokiarchaeota archaeon]|nr:hypothetical protein [Candidatus Lokiarchaeota archaeon]